MVFNSYVFLVFFPIVVSVYYVLPKKIRPYWLLISSYYFYMSWNAKYAILILLSTGITYFTGILLDRDKNTNTNESLERPEFIDNTCVPNSLEGTGRLEKKLRRSVKSKIIVGACFTVNLGILFFFKETPYNTQ